MKGWKKFKQMTYVDAWQWNGEPRDQWASGLAKDERITERILGGQIFLCVENSSGEETLMLRGWWIIRSSDGSLTSMPDGEFRQRFVVGD